MKQTKLFLIAAFSLGMTACTNENYDSLSNHEVGDISTIKLSVENFVSENISRTDFIIDETGANFIWAENDTVGIFPNEGDQLGFPMSEGAPFDIRAKITQGDEVVFDEILIKRLEEYIEPIVINMTTKNELQIELFEIINGIELDRKSVV